MSTRLARSFAILLALGFVLGAGGAVVAQAQVTADDLNLLTWRWVGPVNFSGRISEFAVPPGQTTTYYVLAASGGVWKTEDAGTHFEPIFDKYGNMSMGSLGIAASDPKVLYLGTGEPMHARSSSHGNGVWKSVDAGKTWTNVGLAKSYFIPKVQVDPKNPDVVYVAAEGKLYDNETDSERGFFVTTDGGKTWERRWPLADRGVGEFVVDPRDFNVVIAQAYKLYRRAWTYIDRQPGNHLYKTTDGGKTWKKLTQGLPTAIDAGRAGLAIFLKNPDIVYARIDEEVNLGLAERDGGSNFRAPMGTGGMGFGGGGNYAENKSFDSWKAFKIDPLLAKQAPKFVPIVAADEAELVKKLNEHIADKDFLTKSGIDLAAFNAAARKVYAKNKDLVAAIDEIEKLQKREAPKADSAEAKGRVQATNRHVLEMLYGGILRNQQPVKRSGVVYRSADLGETWAKMTEYKLTGGSALVNQTEAGYYARLYVDAQNDQTLYACDTNTTVSTDGGKTFKATGWDQGAYKLHVDHRALWLDPQNSNHIMSGNDGGAGETWDGGKHWHQKATISAQQFYDVAADNEQPYNVMGGTQDNGAWWGPSQNRNSWGVFAADWNYLPTGDAYYVVRDWWDPDYMYYESQFGASSRINLGTGEISGLAKRTTAEELAKGMPAQRYQWNAPIVLSPHNPGIVYICSQFVHRSLSRGERDTFVTISPDLSRADKTRRPRSRASTGPGPTTATSRCRPTAASPGRTSRPISTT
ncbi:MAG: BNR/Asp-box repeat protein [Candidatus Aminicenantes bacterium]|nr:BNR/Asp-box repeat protein [Candidatus Aminicenantes bacterium]